MTIDPEIIRPVRVLPPTTPFMRIAVLAAACALGGAAYALAPIIGARGQAACGAVCFILIVASCSMNLYAVNWRTIGWGVALQLALAIAILKLEIGGVRPGYALFAAIIFHGINGLNIILKDTFPHWWSKHDQPSSFWRVLALSFERGL